MRIKHCDDEAENFARLSYQCYINIGKEDYAISALISLANAKIHKNQLDSCKIYAEDILSRAQQVKDTASIIEALRLKEHYAVINDSIELALSTIRNLNDYAAYIRTSGELAMLSYVFSHKNEIDSVRKYIRLSLSEARTSGDSSFCYAFAAKAFDHMGDYRCAIAYKDSMFHFANTLLSESLKHTSIAAQRDYVASQLSISTIKNRNQKLILGCICAVFCCIGIILFLLYKRNVAINELQTERIKNLQNELLKVTDEQRSGFYQIQNNELLKILHQKTTNGQIVTNDEWGELDSLFYTLYPIYGERLRSLHPLSSTEWKVCMLIKVGFIPSEIAELMNKSMTSISSVRSRLFEKIFQRKGKPADLDKFLMTL